MGTLKGIDAMSGIERPILFCGSMVRAIIDGRKTQTRRVIKPPRKAFEFNSVFRGVGDGMWHIADIDQPMGEPAECWNETEITCPYGEPGDRLWVKETWAILDGNRHFQGSVERAEDLFIARRGNIHWKADALTPNIGPWRPSIFMPRWASRIILEIVNIRAEKIQCISDADAIANGIERIGGAACLNPWTNYLKGKPGEMKYNCSSPRRSFQTLWDSINKTRGYKWEANPWVWVIALRRLPAQPTAAGDPREPDKVDE